MNGPINDQTTTQPVIDDREIVIRIPYSKFCILFAQLQTGAFNVVYDTVCAINAQVQPQLFAWQQAVQAELAAAESANCADKRSH